ncbi:MAG: dihydrolipoyl dehydrogenase [Nitrospinales bacterium]
MTSKNLLVLGGGPGGYTAAFLAADKGMKVTLVDTESKPGGVCLHRGCIPSKALLHVARLISEARQARQWGITFSEPEIDLDALRKWKNQVVAKMAGGLVALCKKRGVAIVTGRGVFKDSRHVVVDGKNSLEFDRAILAVGSSPIMPSALRHDSPLIMDSTGALEMEEVPERLLIVGGGYIGLEMGTVYAALGSRVTVVEMMDGILPGIDRDLVRPLQARLKKAFENILLQTGVESLEAGTGEVVAGLKSETGTVRQTFDRVLVSVGRAPNSGGIGLENTGVRLDDRGFVRVDKRQRTDDSGIYAIGDVVGGAMLAHKASSEAKVAVDVMAGESAEFDNRAIPAVVFTDPEIAWCGLTETEARTAEREVQTASFPWGASGRATTLDRNDGLTKLVVEPKTGRILGVGIVGAGAGELIAEAVLAVEMGAVARDLALSIHPHPTLSETLMEAAELHIGHPVHIFKKREETV